jgi:hypothetical protein
VSARFEPGELVDITIRGARVRDMDADYDRRYPGDLPVMLSDGRKGRIPDVAEVTVTRVAPKEWPPQPGDVWRNEHGVKLFATEPFEGQTDLRSTRGDVFEKSETALEHLGPLKLVYREGWSPEPAPAAEVETPEKLDKRAEVIAGLREMADWFEGNPGIPLDLYGWEMLLSISKRTEEAEHAELLRVAALVGEPADLTASHPGVRRKFRGGVTYRAYYIPTAKPAAKDIAGEGGEAAGSGEGPAAAPAETGAVPALTEPDELVWVATRRSGIAAHAISNVVTEAVCGRSIGSSGQRMPRSEAAKFAVPCDRCYGAAPAGAGVS